MFIDDVHDIARYVTLSGQRVVMFVIQGETVIYREEEDLNRAEMEA